MPALVKTFLAICFLTAAAIAPCRAQGAMTHPNHPGIPGLIKYIEPEYPRAAAIRGIGGRGIFRLTINPKTGEVDEVIVLKSTGVTLLNESCAKAFLSWRFQPGSVSQVVVPFEFSARGYSRVLH
jgi:TonB family protein